MNKMLPETKEVLPIGTFCGLKSLISRHVIPIFRILFLCRHLFTSFAISFLQLFFSKSYVLISFLDIDIFIYVSGFRTVISPSLCFFSLSAVPSLPFCLFLSRCSFALPLFSVLFFPFAAPPSLYLSKPTPSVLVFS